jgi:hypothetical protein
MVIDPALAQIVAANLGFWNDIRAPWSPDQVIALGTLAPDPAPRVAVATWPLAKSPRELFTAAAGAQPDFAVFGGADAQALLDAQKAAGLDPSFPLWRDPADNQRYLIGLRMNPTGGNHIWVPYRLGAAAAGTVGTPGTPGTPTAVPGSALGRPSPTPAATAAASATP